MYNNQWQPFADFQKPFYNLWQPTAEQRFWEVVEKLATGLYLCVTGALAVKNYISVLWNVF